MARCHGWCLRLSALVGLGAGVLVLAAQSFAGDTGSGWISYGHDPANTRNQPLEPEITPSNVGQPALNWVATTTGDVFATPAVSGGAVYFGDFGGTLWKLDAATGAVIWSHPVPDTATPRPPVLLGVRGAPPRRGEPASRGDGVVQC